MFGRSLPPSATPTHLDDAILGDRLAAVRAVLQHPVLLQKPVRGHLPLVWAAHTFLTEGRLPGPHATASTHLAILDVLLAKGAWATLPPAAQAGFLPLMVANPWPNQGPQDLGPGGGQRLAKLVERLVPLGLDLNGVDARGETALFGALRAGQGQWAAALLGVGVDPSRRRPDGRLAHEEAAQRTSPNWHTLIEVIQAKVKAGVPLPTPPPRVEPIRSRPRP